MGKDGRREKGGKGDVRLADHGRRPVRGARCLRQFAGPVRQAGLGPQAGNDDDVDDVAGLDDDEQPARSHGPQRGGDEDRLGPLLPEDGRFLRRSVECSVQQGNGSEPERRRLAVRSGPTASPGCGCHTVAHRCRAAQGLPRRDHLVGLLSRRHGGAARDGPDLLRGRPSTASHGPHVGLLLDRRHDDDTSADDHDTSAHDDDASATDDHDDTSSPAVHDDIVDPPSPTAPVGSHTASLVDARALTSTTAPTRPTVLTQSPLPGTKVGAGTVVAITMRSCPQ
jgi:hypothetical protein